MNTLYCYHFPDGVKVVFFNNDRKNHIHTYDFLSFDNVVIDKGVYKPMKIKYETWKKRIR